MLSNLQHNIVTTFN